ncbi:MauE/DoxX family redox-associated membrane protein [Microbacterium sp. AK031]|uniref:MauE/DoxX family redox-associated membrane protein n=1 Tax=Microbacterium sp. AK031 TaxID=2723076 RepID=UPI002168558F|nr:MauE/DoxX family redox-associated membrane protein [Microbacterium sp. AK031]MCS3841750.1 hypothetical protein [Microbacterium sp. AK031]
MQLPISPVGIVIDVATGLIAVTLLWSGLAKLRTPLLTLKAMAGLRAPTLLQRRWFAFSLPFVELLLGATLIVTPGLFRFAASVLTTAMFAVFMFYVARAVAQRTDVACNCFGSSSHEPVDRFTVARNLFLVIGGVLALCAGFSAPAFVFSLDPIRVVAFVVALLFVALVMKSVTQHRHINRLRTIINQRADRYKRDSDDPLTGSPIPDAELVSVNGTTVPLSKLGRGRAVLLIFAKAGCGDCGNVARSLPDWTEKLGGRVVPVIATSSDPQRLFTEHPEFIDRTYFGASAARTALGVRILPTAVLLASDAEAVATEVIEGSAAISEFVSVVEEQLAD